MRFKPKFGVKFEVKNAWTLARPGISFCLHLFPIREHKIDPGGGYEMVQEINKRSDGLLVLNITTLYLTLKRLNEHGYVSYYSDAKTARERSRIYYHLEPAAWEYKQKLKEEYERVVAGVKRFPELCGSESVY